MRSAVILRKECGYMARSAVIWHEERGYMARSTVIWCNDFNGHFVRWRMHSTQTNKEPVQKFETLGQSLLGFLVDDRE